MNDILSTLASQLGPSAIQQISQQIGAEPGQTQSAVQADQEGNFVLVVEAGVVKRRNVVLDERVDDKIVVQQGLDEGEQVIVRGLQQVRPGQPVKTQQMPAFES